MCVLEYEYESVITHAYDYLYSLQIKQECNECILSTRTKWTMSKTIYKWGRDLMDGTTGAWLLLHKYGLLDRDEKFSIV